MSSRNEILEKIKDLKLEAKPLPIISEFEVSGDLEERFIHSILSNKGEILTKSELESRIKSGIFPKIYTSLAEFKSVSNQPLPDDPHVFKDLDLAIIRGQFGVAENGAIWLEDLDLELRALPFITEHLAIVLDRKLLVGNMHQAYSKIGLHESGFGLFIAGPSKTADIEQSLVIGAHGAKSLLLILV
jgi:L-lactate dehydrogenase complex protein LldG